MKGKNSLSLSVVMTSKLTINLAIRSMFQSDLKRPVDKEQHFDYTNLNKGECASGLNPSRSSPTSFHFRAKELPESWLFLPVNKVVIESSEA